MIFKLVCKPPFTPRDAISVKQSKRSVLERFVSSLHQATQLSEKETIILWDGECQEHPDTIFAAMKEYCETGIQSLPFDDVKVLQIKVERPELIVKRPLLFTRVNQ